MDPTTTYRTMLDWDADPADRVDAAEALADWLESGGFLPAGPWSTIADQRRRRRIILAECASVIDRAGRMDIVR